MKDFRYNIIILIVLIVFAIAGVGINYIADAIGVPDGISNAVGYIFLVGLFVLYLVYRQKESNEIAALKEEKARLEERVKKTDYYIEEYQRYRERYYDLKREKETHDG